MEAGGGGVRRGVGAMQAGAARWQRPWAWGAGSADSMAQWFGQGRNEGVRRRHGSNEMRWNGCTGSRDGSGARTWHVTGDGARPEGAP